MVKKAKPIKRKFITNQPGQQNVAVMRKDRRRSYRRVLYKPYGDQGVDPPPIPPPGPAIHLRVSAQASQMWQDIEGTIPVTADGQPVGKMDGFTAAANNATRPIYRAAGINGKPCLEFDGLDDVLWGPINAVSEDTSFHIFFVGVTTTYSDFTGFCTLYDLIDRAGNTSQNGSVVESYDRALLEGSADFKRVDSLANDNTINVQNAFGAIALFDYEQRASANKAYAYLNGALVTPPQDPGVYTPTPFIPTRFCFATRPQGLPEGQFDFYCKCNWGEFRFYDHALSPEEQQTIRDDMMTDWGLIGDIPPLASGSFAPPPGSINVAYSYATAPLFTGGTPVSYAINGTLPVGITINTATGLISGTCTTETFATDLSVTATNANGSDTTNTADLNIIDEPPPAAGWQTTRNFESGSLGARCQGADAFSYTWDLPDGAVYSDEQAETGTQCAKTTCPVGTDGWGYFGGEFPITGARPKVGDTFWMKVAIFFPLGWSAAADGPSQWIKGLRAAISNNNVNHIDTAIHVNNSLVIERNGDVDNQVDIGSFNEGEWTTIERAVTLNNGADWDRVWINGVLIWEANDLKTCSNSNSEITLLRLFTQWNGGPLSVDQTCYVDNVVYGTQDPAGRDAAGNHMIGPTGWVNP